MLCSSSSSPLEQTIVRSRNIAVSPVGGTACEAHDKVEVAPCGCSSFYDSEKTYNYYSNSINSSNNNNNNSSNNNNNNSNNTSNNNNNNNNNEAVELHWFFFVYAEISDAGRYDVLKLTGGPRLV